MGRDGHPRAGEPAPGALSGDEFSAAVAAVTSAFGAPTRRDIFIFARDATEGVTAAEVADAFELHPNVARHHLEKLTAGGYLTVALSRQESAGRPSKRYQAALHESRLTFPPRRDDLLATLLARSLEMLDPDAATAMAEEVGYEYGQALAARMGPAAAHRSVRTALDAVADTLTAHGFDARAERYGKTFAIVAEQCPFGEAAQRYPHVLCAVDRGMIRGMLSGIYGETEPRFAERRPQGDHHCVACV
ncbi:MAG: helix-turn-helix transcriptional regulator [Acidimicrobiia bacterium]